MKVKILHLCNHPNCSENLTELAFDILKCFDVYPLLSSDYRFNTSNNLTKTQQEEFHSKGIELTDKVNTSNLSKLNLLVLSQQQMTPEDLALVAGLNDDAFILVDNDLLKSNLIETGFVEVANIEKFYLTLLKKVRKAFFLIKTFFFLWFWLNV